MSAIASSPLSDLAGLCLLMALAVSARPAAASDSESGTGLHAPPPLEELPVSAPDPQLDALALPQGWTLVAPSTRSSALPPSALPPSAPRPPPSLSPAAATPAGWRSVSGPGSTLQRPADQRPADQRRVALGGTVGGGSAVGLDGLLRVSPSVVFDLGVGPALSPRTMEPVSTRLLAGLTWQPGQRTTRHGLVLRGGLGADYRPSVGGSGATEALALAGYAWRLVPRHSPITLELEAAPGVLARARGPGGQPWVGVVGFARVGMHLWLP